MKAKSLWRYLAAAELSYRRRPIVLVYAIVLGAMVIRWFAMLTWATPAGTEVGIAAQVEVTVWVTIAGSALVTHLLFSGFKSQRRNRMLMARPVSPKTIIASRLVMITALQAIPLGFWLLGYALLRTGLLIDYDGAMSVATLPPHRYDGTIWTLINMFAVCLYVSLLIALAHSWRKPPWGNLLFWPAALIFTSVFVYPAGSSPEVFVPGYGVFNTPWGTLYYGAIAAGMAISITLLYVRKQSFCD